MVEKSYTSPGAGTEWWPTVFDPLRSFGRQIANFFTPSADASLTEDAYEVNVELPGVAEGDIDITLQERTLTIKGEKHAEHEEKGRSYYFSERSYGAFQRSFRLPEDANAERVTANFKDGVLTVRVGKTTPEQPSARKINISRG